MIRFLAHALAAALLATAPQAEARTVLFIGNSFTFGANSPVQRYRADRVTDLNREANGGVPALFKTFADEAGLDWQVSLETSPGKELAWHLDKKRAVIERAWDAVVLQGFSTLDPRRPGDPTRHVAAARDLAALFRARNPAVVVDLVATWTRADLTYRPGARWSGQPVFAMADELAAATDRAIAGGNGLDAAVAVGSAWNRAIRDGLADADPYDGVAFGQISLWSWDQYHASAEGYYLEALMVFGTLTGTDPHVLDGRERAADDLGLDPRVATRLRAIAADELRARGRL
jgi:hypothetical protein